MSDSSVSIGSENSVSFQINPRELRVCRAGHSWYATGALYVNFGVFSKASDDKLFSQPDVVITTKDLCPFCLCEKLDELCGGVVGTGTPAEVVK